MPSMVLAAGQLDAIVLQVGQHLDLCFVVVRRLFECGQLFAVELESHGQFHGQGVDRLVVDAEFVVQMRAGGPARGAHIAYYLALRDLVAFLEAFGKPALMGVGGGVVMRVRSEEGRWGKGCVSTFRSGWWPDHKKKH